MEGYLIPGACNPPPAHRAIEADRSIGLPPPCDVVVRPEGERIAVQALDAGTMVTLTGQDALKPVTEQATRRPDDAPSGLTGGRCERRAAQVPAQHLVDPGNRRRSRA